MRLIDADALAESVEYTPGNYSFLLGLIYAAPTVNTAERDIKKPCKVVPRYPHCRPAFFCPVCQKQQKDTFPHRRGEPFFCERCGQQIYFKQGAFTDG